MSSGSSMSRRTSLWEGSCEAAATPRRSSPGVRPCTDPGKSSAETPRLHMAPGSNLRAAESMMPTTSNSHAEVGAMRMEGWIRRCFPRRRVRVHRMRLGPVVAGWRPGAVAVADGEEEVVVTATAAVTGVARAAAEDDHVAEAAAVEKASAEHCAAGAVSGGSVRWLLRHPGTKPGHSGTLQGYHCWCSTMLRCGPNRGWYGGGSLLAVRCCPHIWGHSGRQRRLPWEGTSAGEGQTCLGHMRIVSECSTAGGRWRQEIAAPKASTRLVAWASPAVLPYSAASLTRAASGTVRLPWMSSGRLRRLPEGAGSGECSMLGMS